MKLLRFNNKIIQTNDIDSFFKCFRYRSCDIFFHKSDHFNKHLVRCKHRVRHVYPKNTYTLRETLFEKLDGLNIPYIEDQKLISNVAIFDSESKCVPTDKLKELTDQNKYLDCIGKHVPISVSIFSNLQDDPIFLSEKHPELLIIAFGSNLELQAEKSKLQMRTKFQETENTLSDRVKMSFDKLNIRNLTTTLEVFDYEDECIEDEEDNDMSTNFLRIQKNQLIDLKQHLERYVKTSPLFGFNSGRYNLNLIKSYLIPYLICDKEIEPTVIKKQIISYHSNLEISSF